MRKLLLGIFMGAVLVGQLGFDNLGGTHVWASNMGPTLYSVIATELGIAKDHLREEGYYHCGYAGDCRWIPPIKNYPAEVML